MRDRRAVGWAKARSSRRAHAVQLLSGRRGRAATAARDASLCPPYVLRRCKLVRTLLLCAPYELPDSNFKQPTTFSRAHALRGLRYFPLKRRGGRSAETALVRIAAAPRWPASRSGRSPVPRRSRVDDRRASRRSTAAISVLGPRFSSGHLRPDVSQLLAGRS